MDRPGAHVSACGLLLACLSGSAAAQSFVYQPKVRVARETRIDWVYPLLHSSPAQPPDGLLESYASTRQAYERYAPRMPPRAGGRLPLILHVSFTDTPRGWRHWRPICTAHGVLFACPHDAGNRTPPRERVRIVLDVLDDMRRRYPVDPDRTYLIGYSGGASTALMIATALPEYFGGVVASNAFGGLPRKFSELHRVRERLSVAMLAGERETYSVDVGEIYGPIFAGVGVRTLYRVYPGLGHAMPGAGALEQVFQWLEAGVQQRRATANRFPSSRIDGALTRGQQAARVLIDAQSRLEDPQLWFSGMMQLEGAAQRWPGLPEAEQARAIVAEHKSRDQARWEKAVQTQQLAVARVNAECFEAGARTGKSSISKLRRAAWARAAIQNWRLLIEASEDPEFVKAAEARLPLLERIAANSPRPAASQATGGIARNLVAEPMEEEQQIPSDQVFSFKGMMTVGKVIEKMKRDLAKDGLRIRVDQRATRQARLAFKRPASVEFKNASPTLVLSSVLGPVGLTHRVEGTSIIITSAP